MLATLLAAALSVQVGDAAPPITPASWVGEAPDLKGKPVLVEFWGTWCGPCVATMPHVQDLWARYREKGLMVVAISYEAPDVLSGFADKHGLTMPLGSDPDKALVGAYGIESWPTTFVIGKDGKVIYRGWPLQAEAFVQQALGIETSESVLLTHYVKGEGDAKGALESLAHGASHAFDLASWARGQGAAPASKPPKDPGASLTTAAAAPGAPAAKAQLNDMAAVTDPFDLRGWAERELNARFPISDDELGKLLKDERYADVLDALVSRNPSDRALARAKGDDGLRDWCHERVEQATEEASFVVLIGHWAFGEYKSPPEIAFPPGVGMETEKEGKGFKGVQLKDGELLERDDFPACIEPFLARTIAVQSLAKRKLPSDLHKAAAKLHADLLADLKKKYGTTKAPATEVKPN